MTLNRFVPRTLLSSAFIVGGVDTLRDPEPRVKKSHDVIARITSSAGFSVDPELMVKLNAAVQIGAGALLTIGRARRLSAIALAASLLPTTYAGHRFWELADPQEREQQRMQFMKNAGLLGGLLVELLDTEGRPSLPWRARQRIGRTTDSIGDHVSSASNQVRNVTSHVIH